MKNEKKLQSNVKKSEVEFKNLWESVDEIYYYSTTNPIVLQNYYDQIKFDESDFNLMIMLLLWVNPNSIFKSNEQNYCNSFTKFLSSLKALNSSFFDKEINWYYTDNNHLVFVKDDLLFILNNNDYDISSQLPDEFMNSTLHCENCNEDITVTTSLDVPSKTFYIITK